MSGAVTVKGGTLKVMSASGVSSGATTVKDGATLEVASGASLGSSEVTLEAGSTLALTATSNTFSIPNTLNLPTEGTATIRIDGARLSSGDHTIATVASGTTANVNLDPASTALDGRKGSLKVVGSNLVLNIEPTGAMVIVF
jgi:hypothetical protein